MKRFDGWFVERFDRAGYQLQTKLNWHIVDIWKVGNGGILALMTAAVVVTGNLPTTFVIAPYAIMWGFFLAIALPWLSRQKRSWSPDRMVWWFGWVNRLRWTFQPMRFVLFLMVLFFAFGPSVGNYVYGYPETWGRFALTIVRSVITPGGVIFATYLMGIYPVPPVEKAQEKEKAGLSDWLMKPQPSL
ncbi:hypothetical protein [Rhizobium sp. MHM7A]|uniref:hypothetical protein n=1 Tax=Rhizobium sp. MHM7A TaxID=2583233 RepID=UPI001106DEE2|nr:hypothetical protein [Rhizobium sp. MHM7A]TLX15802.1 hypothetical protein FFR93_00355 [Rhizobium sp. MHM7A]